MKLTKNVLSFFLALNAGLAAASSYHCELKVRENLMAEFESKMGVFQNDRPIEIKVKDVSLRVKSVTVDGVDQLALWMGIGEEQSAVTLAPLDQKTFYLNHLVGEYFSVASCKMR